MQLPITFDVTPTRYTTAVLSSCDSTDSPFRLAVDVGLQSEHIRFFESLPIALDYAARELDLRPVPASKTMWVNYLDWTISATTLEQLLAECKLNWPSSNLELVKREIPPGGMRADVYRMRGATHTGYAIYDGESYSDIWTE